MSELAIRIEQLGKRYALGEPPGLRWPRRGRLPSGPTERWALRGMDLEVPHGQIVGIVGSNGAGKSTLLKILARITPPTEGRAVLEGRVGSLLEVGTGFHPELTGRENVYLNGALLGMRRAEIDARFDEIAAFAQVDDFLDSPVKHFSSGMRMRLAFAVAAHLSAEILIVDEVLAVGDAAFQRRCLRKMDEVSRSGRTVLFVSHNMNAVMSLCTRAIRLEHGRLVDDGDPVSVVAGHLDQQQGSEPSPLQHVPAAPERDAQILSVRVLNARGEPSLQFAMDEPFQLDFEFEVRRDFDSLLACCQVRSRWDELLLVTFETDAALYRDETDSAEQSRRAGRYRARVRFPAPLLNAGDYALVLMLMEPRKQVLHELPPIAFTLAAEGSFSSKLFYAARYGVLALPVPWEVECLSPDVARRL